MPKKKHILSDAERRKRLRETAEALGTSDNPNDFERAFRKVTAPPKDASKGES